MRALSGLVADRLRNSYWFTPTLMCVGAVLLSILTLEMDRLFPVRGSETWWGRHLIYSGDPDGARQMLSTVAGSIITVAGVVFSITIVTLTLASQQFGTRLLANFVRDRGNHVTFGTFLAAFVYSLLVMRTIPTPDGKVPHLSVTVALALALAGVGVLVFYIHHVAVTIQAPNLIHRIRRELQAVIDRAYPAEPSPEAGADGEPVEKVEDRLDERETRPVAPHHSGYVQLVDLERIHALATEHDLVVRVDLRPGRFAVFGAPFAHAWPADRVDDALADRIAQGVVTGARRTPQQDVEFPLKELTEVAVRALSPAVNDPFTAVISVDQMSTALCQVAGRPMPRTVRRDADGTVRVFEAHSLTFATLVGSAYDQIRQSAGFHAPVYVHLLDALRRIAGCVRDAERLDPLRREADLVWEAATEAVPSEADRETVRARYEALREAVDRARRDLGSSRTGDHAGGRADGHPDGQSPRTSSQSVSR